MRTKGIFAQIKEENTHGVYNSKNKIDRDKFVGTVTDVFDALDKIRANRQSCINENIKKLRKRSKKLGLDIPLDLIFRIQNGLFYVGEDIYERYRKWIE